MVLAETDAQATANIVIRRTVANEAQRILRRRSSKSLILYDSDADDDEKDHDQHDDHDAISETEQSEGIPRRRRSSSGDLARISCDDLVEGQLTGSGAFNDVHSVRILNIRQNSDSGDAAADADANTAEPRRKISNASTVSESVQSDGDSTHHGQCACRHIGSDEPGGYVIKHLCPSVMKDIDKFRTGAVDLAYEAKLLASLSHDNIIKIRGVSAGSLAEAFTSDEKRGYFLVLPSTQDERGCGTHQRLHRGRKRQVGRGSAQMQRRPFLLSISIHSEASRIIQTQWQHGLTIEKQISPR